METCLAAGNERIVIVHCPSGYPSEVESIHLRMIQTLRTMFPFPVAFSDHTPGWDMDVAALVLGASLVEKTITRDRTTPSVEHVFSLEGDELGRFIGALRDVEKALGQPRRVLSQEELERRNKVRRSLFSIRPMKAGEVVRFGDIDFRRPGTGLQPDLLHMVEGKQLAIDVPAGHMFALADFAR